MNLIRLSVLTLLVPFALGAAPDVRKVSWGMTSAQVIAIEGKPRPDSTPGVLMYKTNIYGVDADLGFQFFDQQLVRVIYLMGMDSDSIIATYDKFLTVLKEKYGTPFREEDIWQSDFMKDKPGTAIAFGQLERHAVWTNERTQFALVAQKDKLLRCQLVVMYQSVELSAKETDAAKKKTKDDL